MTEDLSREPEQLELPRLISVRGIGKVEVPADLAEVQISVEWTASSLAEAKAAVAEKLARSQDYLESKGIGDGLLGSRSLRSRHHSDSKPLIISYTITSSYVAKIFDLDAADEIVNGLIDEVGDGITIGSFVRRCEDPNAGYDEALALAYADASRQAQAYAAVAGVELGRVFSIDQSGGPIGALGGFMARGMGDLPLDTNDIETAVAIHVKFQFS